MWQHDGGHNIKNLARVCPNDGDRTVRSTHGQRIVDQLARGVLPEPIRRHYGAWPEEILQAIFIV